MKRLRTGILGCGSYAQQHARMVLELGDQLELVAFVTARDRASGLTSFANGTAGYTDPRN
jgi:predicted dehydrogenase